MGKKGRKCLQTNPSPPSPPSLIFLALVSFLARSKPKIPFLGLFFAPSETKRKRLLRRLISVGFAFLLCFRVFKISAVIYFLSCRTLTLVIERVYSRGGTPIHYLYGYVPPNGVVILGYPFQRRFLERGIIFRTHESSSFVSSHLKLFKDRLLLKIRFNALTSKLLYSLHLRTEYKKLAHF